MDTRTNAHGPAPKGTRKGKGKRKHKAKSHSKDQHGEAVSQPSDGAVAASARSSQTMDSDAGDVAVTEFKIKRNVVITSDEEYQLEPASDSDLEPPSESHSDSDSDSDSDGELESKEPTTTTTMAQVQSQSQSQAQSQADVQDVSPSSSSSPTPPQTPTPSPNANEELEFLTQDPALESMMVQLFTVMTQMQHLNQASTNTVNPDELDDIEEALTKIQAGTCTARVCKDDVETFKAAVPEVVGSMVQFCRGINTVRAKRMEQQEAERMRQEMVLDSDTLVDALPQIQGPAQPQALARQASVMPPSGNAPVSPPSPPEPPRPALRIKPQTRAGRKKRTARH